MSDHSTPQLRTVEFKLYPNVGQQQTLDRWLRLCCRTYNQALEQRITAHRETRASVTLYDQMAVLAKARTADAELQDVPSSFARGALRRLDRGMAAFFRRCKAGDRKPGFPRFRPQQRYNSLEILRPGQYIHGNKIRIPKLGMVRARGAFNLIPVGFQKLLRVVRRASGWYAQVLVERAPEPLPPTGADCGLDLGLTSFLTLDTGETVENPRLLRKATRKLRAAQKRLSRCRKGSRRRLKAKRVVARTYERLTRRRKGFCHRVSRDLVNRFDRIAVEDLNVGGLARSRLAKSILDACWGFFVFCLTFKAANAGRTLAKVDPRYTSQECPDCGAVVPKSLSERVHACPCGCTMPRDQASGLIIKRRAFGHGSRGDPVRPVADGQAGSVNRDGTL